MIVRSGAILLTVLLLVAFLQSGVASAQAPFLPGTPGWERVGTTAYQSYGERAACAGDLDGDGRSELVVLDSGAPWVPGVHGPGKVEVFRGTEDGYETTPWWTVRGGLTGERIAWDVQGIGDVNGDGAADLAISASATIGGPGLYGAVAVFHGGPNGKIGGPDRLFTDADWVVRGENPNIVGLGRAILGVGDVTGDAAADLLVGCSNFTSLDYANTYEGAVFLFAGSVGPGLPGGTSATVANAVWSVEANQSLAYLGQRLHSVGDVNADGGVDFAVTADGGSQDASLLGRHWIYTATTGGVGQDMTGAFATFGGATKMGRDLAAADFDLDGHDDVVLGFPASVVAGQVEAMLLHRGTAGGFAISPWTVTSQNWIEGAGASLAAGDLDGDGRPDLAVLSSTWSPPGAGVGGRVRVFPGSLTGGAAPLAVTAAWEFELTTPGAGGYASVEMVGDPEQDFTESLAILEPSAKIAGMTAVGRVSLFSHESDPIDLCPTWSPDWSVEGLGAPHVLGDFDHDGFDDLLIGSKTSPHLRLYPGSASGLQSQPSWTGDVPNPLAGQYGVKLAGVGRVNQDDFDDVLVLVTGEDYWPSSSYSYDPGSAYVYQGGPTGLSLHWQASGLALPPTHFAWTGTIAPDLNRDGYDDVVLGASGHEQFTFAGVSDPIPDFPGFVHVFFGSVNGVNGGVVGHEFNAGWTATDSQAGSGFGARILGVGDLDGDRRGELLVSASLTDGAAGAHAGALYAFSGAQISGGTPGAAATAWWSRAGAHQGELFGSLFDSGVDVTGDGVVDLATPSVDADGVFSIHVRAGGANGFSTTPRIVQPSCAANGFRLLGDFDGDGYGDIAAFQTHTTGPNGPREGRVEVLRGGPDGLHGVASWRALGGKVGAFLRLDVLSHDVRGDVNGDGRSDLVAFAPGWWTQAPGLPVGRVVAYHGTNESRLEVTPDVVAAGGRIRVAHLGGPIGGSLILFGEWNPPGMIPSPGPLSAAARPLLTWAVPGDLCVELDWVLHPSMPSGVWRLQAIEPSGGAGVRSNVVTLVVQ